MSDRPIADQNLDSYAGSHPTVRIDAGHRIYAIGDIHGRTDLLRALHDKIRADMAAHSADRYTVVHLGDYVDRGADSAGVLDILAGNPFGNADSVFLRGNHEQFMIEFIDKGVRGDAWIANGGAETMSSYGVAPDPWDPAISADALRRALPARHKAFLNETALMHRVGSVIFAHAGVHPRRHLDAQKPKDLMWIRETFLEYTEDLDFVVVHGHTPRTEPEVTRSRINVDTGAWFSGCLTAAVLEKGFVRFLSTA